MKALVLSLLLSAMIVGCGRPTGSGSPTAPTSSTGESAGGGVRPASLRQVNWRNLLQADPNLESSSIPNSAGTDLFVRLKNERLGGHPDLQDILFVDLDGDGAQEAVIRLESGGTAGVIGILVYRESPTGPALAVAKGGYKMGVSVTSDRLVVTAPVYAGWEPNCCPSALHRFEYRLRGADLVPEVDRREPLPAARAMTVSRFYDLVQARQFQEAYQLLSPSFQAANPFGPWSDGYRLTERMVASVSETSDGSVQVELTVTTREPSGLQSQRFQGTWQLIYSEERSQWVLDRADIRSVP